MPISASVGRGGANRRGDTLHVQGLVNLHRRKAIVLPPIAVDGLVGPRTIGGIETFQRQRGLRVVDGRADPGGPTIMALEAGAAELAASQIQSEMLAVLTWLQAEIGSRRSSLPPALWTRLGEIGGYVRTLQVGSSSLVTPFLPAILRLWPRRPSVQYAAAPVAGAAVAIEALIVAFFALCAMLIIIQNAPAMGHAMEDLLRRLQALMARILDMVRDTLQQIRDHLQNNPQDQTRCSSEVARFLQLSNEAITALSAPRDPDPVRQHQKVLRTQHLVKEWARALDALLGCLRGGGGGGGIPIPKAA